MSSQPRTAVSGRRPAASVMGLRDFRLLWGGQAISNIGDAFFTVAVSLRVIEIGGSASDLGLVLGGRILAMVLFALVGGVWADRVPRRSAMMVADGARLAVLLLVVAGGFDTSTVWLAAVTFLMGTGEAFFRPAYGGLVPSLVPEDLVHSANTWRGGMESATAVIGPALGGVVVAAAGTRWALGIDAVTFVASLLCLVPVAGSRPPQPEVRSSVVREAREGLAAVRQVRWTSAVLVMTAVQTMLVVAPHMVLLPVISQEKFAGASSYGLILAIFSLSGLVGTVVIGRFAPRHPGTSAIVFNAMFAAVPLVLLTPFSVWWVAIGYAVAGLAMTPSNVLLQSGLQRQFPARLLGRVTSVDWLCSLGLLPVGLVLVGPLSDAIGRTAVLLTAVAVQLGTALWVLTVPGVRDFHHDQPAAAEHAEEADGGRDRAAPPAGSGPDGRLDLPAPGT